MTIFFLRFKIRENLKVEHFFWDGGNINIFYVLFS